MGTPRARYHGDLSAPRPTFLSMAGASIASAALAGACHNVRAPLTVRAMRALLGSLDQATPIDVADNVRVVTADAPGLRPLHIVLYRGMARVSDVLARLGVNGPFDGLPVYCHDRPITGVWYDPGIGGHERTTRGTHSTRPPMARVIDGGDDVGGACLTQAADGAFSDMRCLSDEVILEHAQRAYDLGGARATAEVVASMSSVLPSHCAPAVMLYVYDGAVVTRRVALGLLALMEGRTDIDDVFRCAARAMPVDAQVGANVYERRPPRQSSIPPADRPVVRD